MQKDVKRKNMKLIDNPSAFTTEQIHRSLSLRGIDNIHDHTTMAIITALIALSVGMALSTPLWKRSRVAAVSVVILAITASLPMFGTITNVSEGFSIGKGIESTDHLFYLCDGIIIIMSNAYGISYEAANLIAFAVVQPALIVYLAISAAIKRR